MSNMNFIWILVSNAGPAAWQKYVIALKNCFMTNIERESTCAKALLVKLVPSFHYTRIKSVDWTEGWFTETQIDYLIFIQPHWHNLTSFPSHQSSTKRLSAMRTRLWSQFVFFREVTMRSPPFFGSRNRSEVDWLGHKSGRSNCRRVCVCEPGRTVSVCTCVMILYAVKRKHAIKMKTNRLDPIKCCISAQEFD